MKVKKYTLYNAVFFLFFFLLSLAYNSLLVSKCELYSCGSVYLPDSQIYMNLYKTSSIELASWNVSGISMIYGITSEIVDMLYINILLVAISNSFIASLMYKRFGYNSWLASFILYCNPAIVYYSQTPTKEVLLYFLTSISIYVFFYRKKILLIPILIFGGLVRYQFFISTFSSYCGTLLNRNRLQTVRFFIFALLVSLPFIYKLPLLEGYLNAEALFLEQSVGSGGVGQYLRSIERTIPLVGIITFPIKSLQNILEPFLGLSLYQGEHLNYYGIKDALSFFFFGWYYIFSLISLLAVIVVGKKKREDDESFVIFLMLTSFILVSMNAFVHGRYIFNILPVVVIFYYSGIDVPNRKFVLRGTSALFVFAATMYLSRFIKLLT